MVEPKEHEALIVKQVRAEVNLWFELEDDEVENVIIHNLRLARIVGEKYFYRVIVEFFSKRTHEIEIAMVFVRVDEFGANVTGEKRTDGGLK